MSSETDSYAFPTMSSNTDKTDTECGMAIPITEFDDVEYLRRVVIHLYDLLDDIDTADDMAKSDDVAYRKIVGRLQAKKRDSGVSSPDGYCLHIEPCEFQTKDERRAST